MGEFTHDDRRVHNAQGIVSQMILKTPNDYQLFSVSVLILPPYQKTEKGKNDHDRKKIEKGNAVQSVTNGLTGVMSTSGCDYLNINHRQIPQDDLYIESG